LNWRGKLIGLAIGLLTKRPLLMVIGLVLGHLYDMGVFSPRSERPPPPAPAPPDPFAALGVASSASDEAVEAAYRRRMSEYHPDRVATAAPEIRELAERRARELNQAYDEIKRQRGR
jgi:hypothetical protein